MLSDWKKRNIIPVFKKGRKDDPGKDIPETFPFLGRLWSRYSWNNVKHIQYKKTIQDSQYGITEGKSCLINLVALCDGVTATVDKD